MSPPRVSLLHVLAVGIVLAAAVPVGMTAADARAGAGFSSGSRGARTFSPPAFTRTAPRGAEPFQRTEAQPGSPGVSAAQPRRFGFGSGLAAGLLGAGLFSLFGGSGGFVQLLLLGALIVLALRLFRRRVAFPGAVPRGGPAFAGAPIGGAAPPRAAGPVPGTAPFALDARDFDAFEALLVDVETAYGREDLSALGRLATPEMLRVFERDLGENRARGLHNDVGDARLLQGDLAESWREDATDYATVAMRFSLRDLMVERVTGRILSGDASRQQEATEIWTFRRDHRGPWRLSGVQQTH